MLIMDLQVFGRIFVRELFTARRSMNIGEIRGKWYAEFIGGALISMAFMGKKLCEKISILEAIFT